jgi:hypothetical protein
MQLRGQSRQVRGDRRGGKDRKGEGMKGWKKRAYEVLMLVHGNEPRGDRVYQLLAEYEAHRAERKAKDVEPPKDAPLSDDYLALWVPRMEAIAKDGDSCVPRWNCYSRFRGYCPVGVALRNKPGACRDEARAWLARPDVVAWKERQKWPRWVTVMTPDGNAPNARRLVACYSQGDWDSFLSPALATAAEIDAVRRG